MTQQNEQPDNHRGANDPGADGEDRDILGKQQEDLTTEDLRGDNRSRVNQPPPCEEDNSDADLA